MADIESVSDINELLLRIPEDATEDQLLSILESISYKSPELAQLTVKKVLGEDSGWIH